MSISKKPLPVIRRLPRYYRYITELKNNGTQRISSSQLAAIMGSTPSQVRQDFNCFGGFGHQGVGYSVEVLQREIEKLLFPEGGLKAVLVGTTGIGAPVAEFIKSESRGVDLVALFDIHAGAVGNNILGLEVQKARDMAEYCQKNKVDIIVVCTTREEARRLAPIISKSGVKGIWNYSHYDFSIKDPDLIVENVHLRDNLMALSYRVSHSDEID